MTEPFYVPLPVIVDHQVTFTAEEGELVGRCACGWEVQSDQRQTNVGRLVDYVILSGLIHSRPERPSVGAFASAEETMRRDG